MEKGRILKSAGTVGGFTLLSRLLGLVRDVLMAGIFGTSLVMSAFVVAFTIPNLFRRLFGEGALSAALVPVLVETREKEGDGAAWTFVNRVLSLTAAVLTVITAGIILAAVLIPAQSPRVAAVLDLLQIMMPYMVFICLAAVSMGILNAFHHFAVSAFAPSLLNIIWILTLLLAVPAFGNTPEEKIRYVAWAVLLAGFLQWAVQWPVLRRFGWAPRFPIPGKRDKKSSRGWKDDERIRKMLLLMGPAAVGMGVTQLNVLSDRLLAMWAGSQAPAALYYSERLIYFPLGIIATALGTVLLPAFAGHAARADHAKIREGVSDGIRHLLAVMIPAAAGLLVLARPIVRTIFEWQLFDAGSTRMTALALQCYAPGLIVFSLAKVFIPAFYGLQDTKTPVRIGAAAVALNLVLNVIFVLSFPAAVKHAGIAFATVLSEAFSMTCLALLLQRRIGRPDWARIGSTAGRALAAAAVMGLAVTFVSGQFPMGGKLSQITGVTVSVVIGAAVYLAAGVLLRLEELGEFVRAFRRKRNR